jgi:hypothetical protein
LIILISIIISILAPHLLSTSTGTSAFLHYTRAREGRAIYGHEFMGFCLYIPLDGFPHLQSRAELGC